MFVNNDVADCKWFKSSVFDEPNLRASVTQIVAIEGWFVVSHCSSTRFDEKCGD